MKSRILHFAIALISALLFAGISLAIVQAQGGVPPTPQGQNNQAQNCASCHAEFVNEWQSGAHGKSGTDPVFVDSWTSQGKPGACLVCHVTGYDPATATWQADSVTCQACHGEVPADHPKEPATVDRSPDLCGRCHSDTRFGWQGWQNSAHYQRGMECATCHDPHSAALKTIKPTDDSNAPDDASQLCINCHKDVSMNFSYSKHHQLGISCIDCHVEHLEQTNRDPHALPDHSFVASLQTCNKCHADQMHSAATQTGAADEGTASAGATPVAALASPASPVTPEPGPVSPMGYAGLAGLVGLAAGMVLAPWLERFYLRVTKHHPHNEE